MSIKKVACCLIFTLLSAFILIPTTHASALSEEEGKALLASINESMDRSADYGVLMSVYAALKTTGFSDYESAAILVNMNRESSITPDLGQNGGGAIGLIQWDFERRDALQNFSKAVGDTKYTIKGYSVGDIGTQVAFLMAELTPESEKTTDAAKCASYNWISNSVTGLYKSIDIESAKKAITNSSVDLSKKVSFEEWRKLDDCVAMSLYFTACLERCNYGIDIYTEGAKQSTEMYKLITGTDVSNTTLDKETSTMIANSMALCGLWDESEFASYCGLAELSISFPDRSSLSLNEIGEIVDWKKSIDYSNENKYYGLPRQTFVFIGIVVIVWSVLLYIAFWFDKINNFVAIQLLPILTLGILQVSPDEYSTNYDDKRVGKKVVVHRNMICVTLVGVGLGILLVTQRLNSMINGLINWVMSLF